MRAGSGLPPMNRPSGLASSLGAGSGAGAGLPSALQNAQAALQSAAAGQLQPGGSSLGSYGAMAGLALPGAASLPCPACSICSLSEAFQLVVQHSTRA
jgi:hypothetical protein